MTTIIHIVGNRPQFIKLAVLYRELGKVEHLQQQIIHTGQHSGEQMSGIFFSDLSIPSPTLTLPGLPESSADQFVGHTATALYAYFIQQSRAIIMIYGDTNTTMAAAIAARRAGLPLYHFEAGIRTADLAMPEEINRTIADRLADVNYCCTNWNYQAMLAEGFGQAIKNRLVLTGDLMFDAFLQIKQADDNITSFEDYVACSIHRAGNILTKDKLSAIIDGLNAIHKRIPVVMPVHPHTKKRMLEYGLQPEFSLIDPVGYPAMKTFLQQATFVITDSGGTAREAFFCRKRSVVLMENPFWPEIINEGCSVSSIPDHNAILKAFEQLPLLDPNFQTPIFGTGQAASSIREDIAAHTD